MARLVVRQDGAVLHEYALTKARTSIGRASSNDIRLDNGAVSGKHALLLSASGHHSIEDLSSTNGTYLNGERIDSRDLHDGDAIRVGCYELVLVDHSAAQPPDLAKTQIQRPKEANAMSAPVRALNAQDNEQRFARWQRLQLNDAKFVACLVSLEIRAALRFPQFYLVLAEADEKAADEISRLAFARQLMDTDVSELSLDFQPSTFSSVFELLAGAVTDSLRRLITLIPAMTTLLEGMNLGHENAARFCNETAQMCSREFGNAVQQMSIHASRARAGRPAIQQSETPDGAAVVRNLVTGAMIAANPVIGIGMLLRNVMSDSDRDEQKKKQAAEIWDEIKGARRWANEANAGVMRALEALRTKVERQYEELLNLIFRGLARSRVAPTVSWQDMCEIYLRETAREIRETCVKYPSLREEFSSLQLDPEVAALLP